MPVYKAEAIVLRRRPLGEADRVITFYTREHGKVSAAGRAVRKTTSRLAGRLEPFAHLRLLLARGRTLDVVAQAEVIEAMGPLRTDLDRYARAALVAELLDAAVPEQEPQAALFDLLAATLQMMVRGDPAAAALWFAVGLMSLAGFRPAVEACAVCARPSGGAPAWSHVLGGVVCHSCATRDPAAVGLRVDEVRILAALQAATAAVVAPEVPPRPRDRLLDLLCRYAEHRLEIRLRTPEVIQHLR